IGCDMALHRKRGSGYREQVYQRDLEIPMTEAGLAIESQKLYEIFDELDGEQLVGYYIPDFVVEDKVIVEIKALKALEDSHTAQVIGYLAISGCRVGLLINFGTSSL
ncbi:MAG: GxxExxY protein, partial [Anaerolineales bacterium]